MPDFESVADSVAELKRWSDQLPESALLTLRGLSARSRFGERHGSWFLEARWSSDGLSRASELAFTNGAAIPDEVATQAIVTVRASASSEEAFVAELLYNRWRSMQRFSREAMVEFFLAAIQRASAYSPISLVRAYETRSTAEPGSSSEAE